MPHSKKAAADVNVDQILNSLKSFGFFQISQFILISSMVIAVNSNVFIIVFSAVHSDFKCKNLTDTQLENYTISDNNNVVYGSCDINIYSDTNQSSLTDSLECLNGYEYTLSRDRSIVSEWDLVCHKNGFAELTQTLFIIGQCMGAIIFPILTEKLGRRPMHITCGLFLMLSALMCALSPNYWVFALGRILSGCFEEGYVISGVTAICELFSTNKRSMMTGLYSIIWSSAMSIPALIGYFIANMSWRIYCFYSAATALFFILEIFFVDESIRWLFATGKVIKAKQVIKKACRQNRADFNIVWAIAEKELGKTIVTDEDEEAIRTITVNVPDGNTVSSLNNLSKDNGTDTSCQKTEKAPENEKSDILKIVTIFKYPYTRYITLINVFNWFVINTSYNSIYMLSDELSGNMFLNFFLLALNETVAAGLYCIGISKFGHKISMISCEVLGALSLITASSLKRFGESNSRNNIIFRMLHLSAMFGIGACYGGAYIYTPELYPTDVRSVGLGIASSFSRMGSMLAPFSRVLVMYAEWAPSALFGTCLLASILMICFLPETSQIQLPQTMAELKESRKQKKLKVETDQVYEKDVEEY